VKRGWGAAVEVVKALTAREGRELRSHGELHKEIARLVATTGDEEVRHLWLSATALHQNFYENWLPLEIVEKNIEDVKKLIEKLKKLLQLH
jgi:PaREP1/PaREP8 domain containing family protein